MRPEPTPIIHQLANKGPASFAQVSQWFLNQLDPGSTAYSLVYLYRLDGRSDPAIFQRSLNSVVERHDSLRTAFLLEDGALSQYVVPYRPFELEIVRLDGGDGETSARALAGKELRRPFDLERGPLFRASLALSADGAVYFVFAVHHSVFDAWSRGVFINDLLDAHAAFSAGSEPSLPTLAVTYLDYARWQRESLQGADAEACLARWLARLDGAPPVLNLPLDRPRSPLPFRPAGTTALRLPTGVSQSLREFCRQERATLFSGVFAAWAACLHRYSGQPPVVLGCPFAGRLRPELEQMVGMFVNTLPIRLDVDENATFRGLVKRAREYMLDAITDQAMPFERLVSALNVEHDFSRPPVYQVTLNKRNILQAVTQGGLCLQPIYIGLPATEFDLNLDITDLPVGIGLELQYDGALFMPESAALIVEHLAVLIENALANPDAPLNSLEMMSEAEQQKIVVTWNDTAEPLPDVCPHRLVERWAESNPDHIALVAGERRMSYAELNLAANRLAHRLAALRLAPGTPVGLFVEPSIEAVVGMLAAVKAGGACLPIPDDFPSERIAFMLEDSATPVVLTQAHLADRLQVGSRTIICLDDEGGLKSYPAENLSTGPGRDDPAIIYYTSGSTGRPKGVLVPHRAVLRMAANTSHVQVSPEDVVSQISSLSFDNATEEIWGALTSGATLVILPARQYLSPFDLQRAYERYGVTMSVLTTSFFNLIAQENPSAFAGLRLVDFGGESADYDSVSRVLEHGKPQHLLNGYGPTEATTISTMFEITAEMPRLASIPIGKPISNSTVYVVDRRLRPVPIGVPGELLIGGPGVALGYLNRPELTAEKFIPDHFSDQPGATLYRTGDLARFLPDGNLEFLGRADQQVKLRGYRIELEEIELALREHPAIKEAAVILKEGPQGKFLAAFWTPAQAATVPDLRTYLSNRLPEFMVPSFFLRLESFPYTASAKIDRLALAGEDVSLEPAMFEPPQTETEKRLATLWQEVLGVERVGSGDDFFALGGHSLLAAKLFARIEKEFGKRLPLAAIFRNGTLGALATLIEQDTGEAQRQIIVPMQPQGVAAGQRAGSVEVPLAGGRPPLFLIPGVGASPIYMREFALQFGAAQPVYGLAAVWRDSDARLIEESAEVYSRELQRVLPSGPYMLAGHSGGGLVALEIARRLRRGGREVAFLAFLDTLPPGIRERAPWRERIRSHARNLRRGSPREAWAYFRLLSGLLFARVLRYLPGGKRMARRMLATAPKPVARALAVGVYAMTPYDGPVTIFRVSERSRWSRRELHEGWPRYLRGPLTFVDVPGNHATMLKSPNVEELARQMFEHFPQDGRH